MSGDDPRDHIQTVALVTRAHGDAFANGWQHLSILTGAMWDACAMSGVITWPEPGDLLAVRKGYALVDAICAKMDEELARVVSAMFVHVANEVLSANRDAI